MIVDFSKSEYMQLLVENAESGVEQVFRKYTDKLFSEERTRSFFWGVRQLYIDNWGAVRHAMGSRRKHHVFWLGYLHHITQMLWLLEKEICVGNIDAGWRDYLTVAILLHDIEKVFRDDPNFDKYATIHDCISAVDCSFTRSTDFCEYRFSLRESLLHDIKYAHGELDAHNPVTRVMRPTGAWLHTFDIISSRVYYDKTFAEVIKLWQLKYEHQRDWVQ